MSSSSGDSSTCAWRPNCDQNSPKRYSLYVVPCVALASDTTICADLSEEECNIRTHVMTDINYN